MRCKSDTVEQTFVSVCIYSYNIPKIGVSVYFIEMKIGLSMQLNKYVPRFWLDEYVESQFNILDEALFIEFFIILLDYLRNVIFKKIW